MPKPKPKTKVKVKVAPIRQHVRHPQVKKKPATRKREASTRSTTTKKARPAMSTAAAEPRGAGTGEQANATRDRKYNENRAGAAPVKTTEYPKGDPDAGRIDPEDLTIGQTAEIKPMRDRRAYLIRQAERNEAANDELNAIQVDQNNRLQLVQNQLQDPDRMREESMETAVAMLKEHDPDEQQKTADHAKKQREKADKEKEK